MQRLRLLVTSDGFRSAILFLILLNAFAMGLEASPDAADRYQTALEWVFLGSQVIFVAEIAARWLAAPRGEFFRDSWSRYDFVVVALSLMPAVGEFVLVARILRVLRVARGAHRFGERCAVGIRTEAAFGFTRRHVGTGPGAAVRLRVRAGWISSAAATTAAAGGVRDTTARFSTQR